MKYLEEKELLQSHIKRLLSRNYVCDNEKAVKSLKELLNDVENDFYTVVVLGEFKRGKSTFVNSLIGKDLLPVNVLPTTATINALMYSDKETIEVVKQDGSIQEGVFSKEFLDEFSAGREEDVSKVKFIKIGMRSTILENNVVIIDTPGVSDLNDQRVQVTYNFIPRANAVLFLLDATSPLKKTEKEFIDNHLLKIGLDNVLFIANKYDQIDEEEDDDDLLENIKQRLQTAFKDENGNQKFTNLTVLPLSAKMAMDGIKKHNSELYEESGILAVKKELMKVLEDGSVTANKLERFKTRLKNIVDGLIIDIEEDIKLKNADQAEIKQILNRLAEMMTDLENNRRSIDLYVTKETNTIIAMANKSIVHLHRLLQDDIHSQVESYNGIDFKTFVEMQVTKRLKRSLENWVDNYSSHIDQLLYNIEQNLVKGLSSYFQQQINLQSDYQKGKFSNQLFNFQVEAEDVSSATTKAGAIAAGSAGLILLVGGPILMPFVSMLALPFLQKKFLREKLAEAKGQIIPILDEQLNEAISQLKLEVIHSIETRAKSIADDTDRSYTYYLHQVNERLQNKVKEKEQDNQTLVTETENMKKSIKSLQELYNAI